ncbi:hypothetical protein GCK72_025362 [Caenorhabditis remanei]|uniref:Uncharacterized protein n=1 Tax=Caenorhabditis remanei TaxID=31234 RepID=A0A6A5G2I9_CAERE|nr:hypothetical protein GCK72_025362 [Caenorhabditis remanei]KAF1748895.1 hypothetical protein GCK72_025362 [Caenorhabditis remanei]
MIAKLKKAISDKITRVIRHLFECDLSQPCECQVRPDDYYVSADPEAKAVYRLHDDPGVIPHSVLISWIGKETAYIEWRDDGEKLDWKRALFDLHDIFFDCTEWFLYQRSIHASTVIYHRRLRASYDRPISAASRTVILRLRKIAEFGRRLFTRRERQPLQEAIIQE